MAWGQGRMGMCCHVRWYVIISGAVGVAKRIGWGGSGRPAIEAQHKTAANAIVTIGSLTDSNAQS